MAFHKEKLDVATIKKVGAFRIFQDHKVGSGAFGTVYLCSNDDCEDICKAKTLYAAKIIPKNVVEKKKLAYFEDLVNTEIKILTQLNHPNIVKLIDVRSTENNFYIFLELCQGGTLKTFREKKPSKTLIETEALEIIRQIAGAMICCNQKKPPIIHRDLKPANILLKDGQVKVSDFGLARLVENCDEKLKLTSKIGSPLYMAPEVFTEERYNCKCDVWSLGIILYELLYGVAPWYSSKDTQDDLFNNNILKKPLHFLESVEVSEKTKELIKSMLEINQDKRINFVDILNHKAMERKDKRFKQELDSDLIDIRKSINMNIELLNKNQLVENCYIAKKKTMDFETIENFEKLNKNEENEVFGFKDREEKKVDEGKYVTGEFLTEQDEIIKKAEDFSGFFVNVVTFLRKVFNSIKSKEMLLKSFGIDGKSMIKYMLLLKKMELIILYQIKNILETSKTNDFLTDEFYSIPKARNRILKDLNEQYNDSLDNFEAILQDTKDFPEKKVYFKENFEYNSHFNENYAKEFEKLLSYLQAKKDSSNNKICNFLMEILICQSFDDIFDNFKCIKDRDNTHQFYSLYQDLKDPIKVKKFIEKKLQKF